MDEKMAQILEVLQRVTGNQVALDKNGNPFIAIYYLPYNGDKLPQVMGYQPLDNAPAFALNMIREYEGFSRKELDTYKRKKHEVRSIQ